MRPKQPPYVHYVDGEIAFTEVRDPVVQFIARHRLCSFLPSEHPESCLVNGKRFWINGHPFVIVRPAEREDLLEMAADRGIKLSDTGRHKWYVVSTD